MKVQDSKVILPSMNNRSIVVFDFFCGCGGTSVGFRRCGMQTVWALDINPVAAETFRKNFPDAKFEQIDIDMLDIAMLRSLVEKYKKNNLVLFCGCAPCQPFTKQQTQKKEHDPRVNLLLSFGRIVSQLLPDFVFVENVPGVQKQTESVDGPFKRFKEQLDVAGYHYKRPGAVVAAQEYGTPQMRHRFIFLASRHGMIDIPSVTHGSPEKGLAPYRTVRDAIADLPAIQAGETYDDASGKIMNHRAAALSDKNIKRIQATRHDGGSRLDWEPFSHLRLKCHTKKRKNKNGVSEKHSGHTDVYGRLWWDRPATGLTTRCISYSNGRFGHPEQNRAISVREAARLQGFPDEFCFTGNLNDMARQVGNAVPIPLAEAVGRQFLNAAKEIGKSR